MMTHCYFETVYVRRKTVPHSRGTLVYIHGLGESGLCFETLLSRCETDPELKQWNHFIADLPGYGKSLPAQTPLNLKDYADFVIKICRQQVTGAMVLIGHSMGGVIGMIACECPDHPFSGFIDVEGNLTPGDCVFSSRAAAYDLAGFESSGFQRLRETVYKNGVSDAAQRGYFASMCFAVPEQFHLNSRNLLEFSTARIGINRLKALGLPKLYIAASPSGICRESMALLDSEKIPHVVVAESGHWPFLDQPEVFLKILSGYLEDF